MKIRSVFASVLLVAAAASASATTTDFTSFTLTYDETTSFGGTGFSFSGGGGLVGFGWNVPDTVGVFSLGTLASTTFALPSFTIAVNPGYTLSGPVTGFLGNLVFNEFSGGSTSASASGLVSVDGSPVVPVGGALTKIPTFFGGGFTSGYYVGNTTIPAGGFSTLSFSGGSLTLTAADGASVIGQNQNSLSFGLIATPVPEPETAALMLAGLLAVGSLVHRRRQS